MYQTIFPAGEFEDAILELVKVANFLTGGEARIEKMIVVSTEDLALSAALDGLADSIKARKEGKSTEMLIAGDFGGVKKETKKVKAKLGGMGRASWRNEKTGEIISTMKLHQALKEGRAEVNAEYINAKGVRHVVMLNDLGGLDLIKEPQA